MSLRRFSSGDCIVCRQLWQGRIWAARPAVVVQDTHDLVVSWYPAGTRAKVPRSPNGERARPGEWPRGGWILQDVSSDKGYLGLSVPGEEYSIFIFQHDGRVERWYINLERPRQRTSIGFDHEDQVLDAIVSADLRSWYWDDEDELAEAVDAELITKQESADLYALGMRVVSQLQSGESIFDGWQRWSPDPSWGIPGLPDGWDKP